MGFGNTQLSFKEQKIDGNVLEMDGNVLEMVCPKLLCIGREEGGVGLEALFPPQRSGVFVTLQPDRAGDTRWIS